VTPGRRQPTQERSQRRYGAILDAAAQSFAGFGFDATTMEGIAARAGTSIGSLYQFFPNKHALFREVVRECMRRARAHFERMLGPEAVGTDWHTLLDRVIDGYRELQHDAYLQSVWRNLQLYGEWMEEDEALTREFVGVTAGLIGMWAPQLAADHRRMIALTIVNSISLAMLQLTRVPAADGDALIEETKRMLRRYLAPYVEPA
jgi:AcrR family transcriptional regulator